MTTKRVTPIHPRRTALATAVVLMLSGAVYAAGTNPSTSQYDSALTYDDYRDQQGGYKLRASDLIGRDIYNAEDDEIGEIDDLIVSRDGNKVMAILSLGGFLNLGSKLVAIPYEDLRVTRDGKSIYYNATTDDLKGRAAFNYADGKRPLKATPMEETSSAVDGRKTGVLVTDDAVLSTNATRKTGADRDALREGKPADNSARNARDGTADKLTPLDQSHAETDVDITRNIRKALVDDDSLGTNAQNVKVITVDGMVTLRGPVANANEQARIVAIAKEAAGLDRVQDDLDVKER